MARKCKKCFICADNFVTLATVHYPYIYKRVSGSQKANRTINSYQWATVTLHNIKMKCCKSFPSIVII